jgi:hypothetical protein
MNKPALIFLLAVTAITTSGCVTGRRSIALEVPPTATAAPAAKGAVAITSIVDARVFENKPDDPSTPSIDGDVNKVSKDALKGMIGRQRNGFGKAMGDVELAAGDTVETRTRALIVEGLKRRGYTVADAGGGHRTLEVAIGKFWAWFTPGMWAVDFEAQIQCEMTLAGEGDSRKLTVAGYGKNVGQVASDLNWQQAYERAFDDFLKKLDAALASAGL